MHQHRNKLRDYININMLLHAKIKFEFIEHHFHFRNQNMNPSYCHLIHVYSKHKKSYTMLDFDAKSKASH